MVIEDRPAYLTDGLRLVLPRLVGAVGKHHLVQVRPYHMARSPWLQAKLWRQSRPTSVVLDQVLKMRHRGMTWLSQVMEDVGPSSGPHVTDAVPGLSWHQWGEAVDFMVVVDGEVVWDADHPGYLALAEEAARLGLQSGYFWTSRDAGHVQVPRRGVASTVGDVRKIDERMRGRWESLREDAFGELER